MDTTAILDRIRAGDADAEAELVEALYAELRAAAASYMRRERANHTLQPTELVHEVISRVEFGRLRDGRHVRAALKRAMHNFLIDLGRRRRVRERALQLYVTTVRLIDSVDAVDVAMALEELTTRDARGSAVIQYRVYLGLTIEETAQCLGISTGTVENDFRRARAWLLTQLSK